jgi:hypothetical protein
MGNTPSQYFVVSLLLLCTAAPAQQVNPDTDSVAREKTYRGCLIEIGKRGYFAGKIDLWEKLYINNPCDVTLTGEKPEYAQSYRPPISIGKIRSLYLDPHLLVIMGRRAMITAFKKTCVEIVENASQADAVLHHDSKAHEYGENSGGFVDCYSSPNSASCSDGVTRSVMTCSGIHCESHTEAVTDDWLDLLDGHSYEPLKEGWRRDSQPADKPRDIATAISGAIGCTD